MPAMKHLALFTVTALLLLAGCTAQLKPVHNVARQTDPTDSTIYGLACEGSNDTIIVFLRQPYNGSDPDTLNVLEATRRQQVFGTVRIGDQLAIMRNADDSCVADIVIVTQDLLGQWAYKVKPTLRMRADMENDSLHQTVSLPYDSIRRLLDEEREYGYVFKIDSVVVPLNIRPIGAEDESPVAYPPVKQYRQWKIYNCRVLLTEMTIDTLGYGRPLAVDTAQLISLTADTLVLRFADGDKGFYRKADTTN